MGQNVAGSNERSKNITGTEADRSVGRFAFAECAITWLARSTGAR
jgi:hypothetical protein